MTDIAGFEVDESEEISHLLIIRLSACAFRTGSVSVVASEVKCANSASQSFFNEPTKSVVIDYPLEILSVSPRCERSTVPVIGYDRHIFQMTCFTA